MPLGHRETALFFDRFGSRQDSQAFYEDPATQRLLERGDFPSCRHLLEFGCGTGRLAQKLLRRHLHPEARYLGIDSSRTMVDLCRRRLEPWAERAQVQLTDGTVRLPVPDGSLDCVLSSYVLDLLSERDIRSFLREARRVLEPGGQLCLVSLTPGRQPTARVTTLLWQIVHRLRPAWVGGCRPIDLTHYLEPWWRMEFLGTVTAWTLTSQIVVARAP